MTYATVEDVIALRGAQSADALERLAGILPVISSQFRVEASNHGKDLDAMIAANADLAEVTKCLVVDGAMSYYHSSQSTDAPLTQFAQSALGYSISGSYANPGGGLYTKKAWLKLLGITRPQVGTLEVWGFDKRDNN